MNELCAYGSGTWLHKEKLFYYVLMGPAHGHKEKVFCFLFLWYFTLRLYTGSLAVVLVTKLQIA